MADSEQPPSYATCVYENEVYTADDSTQGRTAEKDHERGSWIEKDCGKEKTDCHEEKKDEMKVKIKAKSLPSASVAAKDEVSEEKISESLGVKGLTKAKSCISKYGFKLRCILAFLLWCVVTSHGIIGLVYKNSRVQISFLAVRFFVCIWIAYGIFLERLPATFPRIFLFWLFGSYPVLVLIWAFMKGTVIVFSVTLVVDTLIIITGVYLCCFCTKNHYSDK